MPLPTITTPTHELTLPSTGKTVKYRPFLVKEEKILILALESGNLQDITRAIKDVLKNCILTRGIKVDKLPTFDIEYLFLHIRSKSVGESVDIIITCPDDKVTEVRTKIYIDEIEVKKDPDHTTDIKIDDTYTLRMKYPSLDQFVSENFDFKGDTDDSFALVASCIDMVYSEDEAWSASDCTKKELITFIEQFNSTQFREIEKFFDTMPKLAHTVEVENPNTGKKSEVVLEGLSSFFA